MKKIISLVLVGALLMLISFYYFSNSNNGNINIIEENKTEKNQASGVKIIAIGDSLTAGYGLNLDDSYPNQLEKKLLENNFNVQIINAGVSGETTAGLLERIDFIKSQKPEIILITIGGNDALRALPVSETEKNILAIVRSLKEVVAKEKIFLMQIQAPANLGISYTRQFNAIHQKIANQENINLVPFVVPEVFTKQELIQNDGIHPNEAGYKYLVDKYIYNAVTKTLQN
jgi:acyl-CoA thioesterase-1